MTDHASAMTASRSTVWTSPTPGKTRRRKNFAAARCWQAVAARRCVAANSYVRSARDRFATPAMAASGARTTSVMADCIRRDDHIGDGCITHRATRSPMSPSTSPGPPPSWPPSRSTPPRAPPPSAAKGRRRRSPDGS
jgi:hypothetical protein